MHQPDSVKPRVHTLNFQGFHGFTLITRNTYGFMPKKGACTSRAASVPRPPIPP